MNRRYILYVLLSFVLASCTGMNDIIQEYLDRGEINYVGKTDSIYAIGGKNRITFKWIVNSDPRIEKMSIAWQNGEERDTLTCDVDRSVADEKGYVSYTFDMPGMEGTFAFYTFHSGSKGYNSISSEVTGSIYGDRYANSIKARKVNRIDAFIGKTQIAWQLSDGSVKDELIYTGVDNQLHSVIVKPLDMMTELPDYKLGTDFKIRSLYVPETETIINGDGEKEVAWDSENEFYVESTAAAPILNLWEDVWTISCSSEETDSESGDVIHIIDNNSSTYWHSRYTGGNAALPHSLTIDMQAEHLVEQILIARRVGNTDLKTAHIEVSKDNITWTPLAGDFEYPNTAMPNEQTVNYAPAVEARYVKVVVTESHRSPFASISEVKVYGALK